MSFEEFQNRSGFEIEHRKIFPSPSKTGSSIPTFRNMQLYLLVWNNFSLQFLPLFLPDDVPYINCKTQWKHFSPKKKLPIFSKLQSFLDKQFSIPTYYSIYCTICLSISPLDLDHMRMG